MDQFSLFLNGFYLYFNFSCMYAMYVDFLKYNILINFENFMHIYTQSTLIIFILYSPPTPPRSTSTLPTFYFNNPPIFVAHQLMVYLPGPTSLKTMTLPRRHQRSIICEPLILF